MYCLLELLTVIGVVVLLATILFVVSAAVVVVDEGMRFVYGLLPQHVRQVSRSSIAIPKPWKVTISNQIGLLDSK